jgi:hypothetical protein
MFKGASSDYKERWCWGKPRKKMGFLMARRQWNDNGAGKIADVQRSDGKRRSRHRLQFASVGINGEPIDKVINI